MGRSYNTRQKALVLSALRLAGARAVTADELMAALSAEGEHVGRATIYRQLERLAEAGKARSIPGPEGTLYQYVEDASECSNHLHCQCDRCGRIFHVDCELLDTLAGHLRQEHRFVLDPARTILQGRCDACREEDAHGAADT